MLITALVLILLVSGGAAAVLLVGNPLGGDTPGSGTGAPDVTAKQAVTPTAINNGLSVLGAPKSHWTVRASDLLPGGTFDALHSWEGADGAETLTFPNATVVHVAGDSDTSYLLTALDPATGKVLWKKPQTEAGNSCYAVAENTRLLCTTSTGDENGGDGGDGTYELFDPATGASLGSYKGAVGDEGVDSDRNWIYLGTYGGLSTGEDHSVDLTKLSATNLHKEWTVPGKDPGPDRDEGDEFDGGIFVTEDSGSVNLNYGYLDWSFNTTTGDQTSFTSSAGSNALTLLEGGYRVTDDTSHDTEMTRVDDVNGNSILTADGPLWEPADFTSTQINNGRIGSAGALYDLSTGKQLWNDPDLSTPDANGYAPAPDSTWSPQGDQVLVSTDVTDDNGTTTSTSSLLNADDGTPVWRLDRASSNAPVAWTDDAVLTVDGTDLIARSRTGDTEAWRESVADLAEDSSDSGEPTYGLGVSTQAAVVVSDAAIRGFTSFPAADKSGTAKASGQETGTGANGDGGTQYVTACGSTPEFTPVESAAANGGITITFEVHAVCPGGEGSWLNGSGQRVTLSGKDGAVYADASFDFSANPYWIPGKGSDPVRLQLTFGYDTVFATTSELAGAITAHIILVACEKEPGSSDGTVPSDPTYGTDPAQPAQASGPSTAAGAAAASQEGALAALRRIMKGDAGAVDALEGQWVPQLSSKKKGTSDDGIVYTVPDILAEHLRLRARYPDSKLVTSTDFGSFLVDGYWVTLVADPSPGWRPALQWCPDNGFDKDHCYAKRIVRDGTPDGNTKHLADLGQ